ncbi:sensor histidine kinase [Thermoflexibacter ruber]|uniref:histidine kinase n=1 Tax=Thermoflexibacter ruber TaxID=1003 RepID=A0A1I2F7D1_9BACT|nr:ATP-binding protein [Thermoflexibacter ruber]SFF00471.1 PAS domain S-box-containing protein [Thermoflexibacter ruber]
MKTKTKLTIGFGLLLILVILSTLLSISLVNTISRASHQILQDNYVTIEYAENMLILLDEIKQDTSLMKQFEYNLVLQQNNITEIGEADLTLSLTKLFERIKSKSSDTHLENKMRTILTSIIKINLEAIKRKSITTNQTADNAIMYIGFVGFCCFLIAVFMMFIFPAFISKPIENLSESIKQIAEENYSQRVNFESHSEFGELAKSFNVMAQKLEEYNNSNVAKLMMEKKRVETLIDKMHDPVIGLDENLKIIFANQEANSVLGLSNSELIGFQSKDLALKNDLLRELIKDIKDNEFDKNALKPIKIFANGRESYFEKDVQHISIIPTGEVKTKIVGHVILLHNVTEYKELDSAKTNFIATISHEFKTPISSIKLSLQLLENEQVGKLNEEQKNLVDSIKDDANRLLKITGELLDMTQVESGNIQLSILPSDPKEILQYAINATKAQADQKQIQFQLSYPDKVSKIQADNEKTAWVLTNLISNAIQYSYDNSTIFLTIKETKEQVSFSVKDTGQGIAPQYKDKIFDRYFRVPGTKKEGTGLGLAISKEFIEAQGGQITVESEFGAGSTFTLILNKATSDS